MRLENNGVTSNSQSSNAPGVASNNGLVGSNGALKPAASEIHSNGSAVRNGMAGKLDSAGMACRAAPMRSDYFGHDREEVTRILIQALGDLGYAKAAITLEDESEYTLESPYVSSFRHAVLKGDWNNAEKLLEGMEIHQDADTNALLFYLRQQKFLELLEMRDVSNALYVLRTELTPLGHSSERVHFLSSLMMCLTADDVKQQANWDGALGISRQHLLSELSKFISPAIMIPEHRLASLLQQVKKTQIANCLYHNTSNPPSLYSDHTCDRNQFPLLTIQTLSDHTDEVYCVKFSHDGTKMASASKDKTIIIWDVKSFMPLCVLEGHTKDVTYVEWSPADTRLVSCSRDKTARLWDITEGICIKTMSEFTEPVSSVTWAPDGQTFITGGMDEYMISWDAQGERLYRASAPRTYDLEITADGSKIVTVCINDQLHVYDFHNWKNQRSYSLGSRLTGLETTKDSRYAIVNTAAREVILVDLENGRVIQRYSGQVQDQWVIRGCLGGANENFVLSGSEDSNIYVWHKQNGQLVEKLAGHTGTVNCVAWNPSNAQMFASAGDDRTIRM
ncbi:WD40-repeat-containing domain protein [Tricharina praecox]|uniref:WD40-repeat-containing domain protein n=1 Tax=Tricharina praecox TaxID=43433 RepID=UPI002220F0E5|nr:WD40-repeat-containing domain protein [Tricharina praecox]KAI5854194.1 WD40-repeat-containing domain protein [Tricharina praecox]